MKRMLIWILALSLLLCGCSDLLNSNYHNAEPHEVPNSQEEAQVVSVVDFNGLCSTLQDMVASGSPSGLISVAKYDQNKVESDMDAAVEKILSTDPIAAYAVEAIHYELGTNAGQSAVKLSIQYLHDRSQIRRIQYLKGQEEMRTAIASALDNCYFSIVLYVEEFEDMDFAQWVSDYAAVNPDKVMELPEVTANIYPEEGEDRVVELKFQYENSRESLKNMQSKVSPLFSAAAIYAGEDGDEAERYQKLYSFLMGLFQSYQQETSITPAYSLLQHGVGDSKAFATVYAAMCKEAGLECIVVTGTKAGDPWYWNIVRCDGIYYHADLPSSEDSGQLHLKTDEEMSGYVWDYSAYSACGVALQDEEE